MTPKLTVLVITAIGIAPAVGWALISIITASASTLYRPVWFSFHLYSRAGGSLGGFQYRALPVFPSLCILAGAALLLFGLVSLLRSH